MELRKIVFIHYKRYNFTTDGMTENLHQPPIWMEFRIILLQEMEICPFSWIC